MKTVEGLVPDDLGAKHTAGERGLSNASLGMGGTSFGS